MASKMSGNKGEWSELYAFFRLLADGVVYAADENAFRKDDVFYPIVKIVREEKKDSPIEYVINRDKCQVDVVYDGITLTSVTQSELSNQAEDLLCEINLGKNSFEIERATSFAHGVMVEKIKAPSSDKTDISMQVEDVYTHTRQNVGFSIKSELGSAPTLLNASKATNFIFSVKGVPKSKVKEINAIDSRTKIHDRMDAIFASHGSFVFRCAANETFEGNLMRIDSLLPDIVADLLQLSYSRDVFNLKELVDILEEENPREYRHSGMYAYKVKKMLCACALGMKPSARWDGHEEANGGYLIVKGTGEILAYHIYNREEFENYLLGSTSLERPSTTRHDYMRLYEENGEIRLNLNLQIRFK